ELALARPGRVLLDPRVHQLPGLQLRHHEPAFRVETATSAATSAGPTAPRKSAMQSTFPSESITLTPFFLRLLPSRTVCCQNTWLPSWSDSSGQGFQLAVTVGKHSAAATPQQLEQTGGSTDFQEQPPSQARLSEQPQMMQARSPSNSTSGSPV